MEVWFIWWSKKGPVQSCGCVDTTVWMHHVNARKMHGKNYMGSTQECYELFGINPVGKTPWDKNFTATYFLSQKPSMEDGKGMWDTAGETRMNL